MSTNDTHHALVQKVWNYGHVLRDQGVSYGDYIEQVTYLLFLKMDQEREDLLGEPSPIPAKWKWNKLVSTDAAAGSPISPAVSIDKLRRRR